MKKQTTVTVIEAIIKNNTGGISDKYNCRSIAPIVTAACKLFEICPLEILKTYLLTHGYQF